MMWRIAASLTRELDRTFKLYLAFLLTKLWRKARAIAGERCWLLSGMSGQIYADNSAALHRYLVENRPDLNVYWVIDRDSPDVDKARQVGPVLYRGDLSTYVYGLLARVHVISHGLADVPTCGSALSKGAVKVRLGHGLTALKKTKGSPLRSVGAKNRVFDLVPVASEFERQNKLTWGIDPRKLVVTGLPRFDDLVRKSELNHSPDGTNASPSRILYMPTWRDWLPGSTGRFVETDFYKQVAGFLLHPALHKALIRHNVFLYVHFHVILHHHLALIGREIADLSHVNVLSPDQDLQDAIVRSSLLITDYSSVAWDFLYLDKPVLFYQFDVEKFNEYRGASIDLNDLFGPIARDAGSAVDLTRRFVESDFDYTDSKSDMERWQRKA
ncbi:CDP-glycerol glycerophosphotransferase family protein, partial [Chloroflexota bacterium]